jgi:DNA-binding transcriptional LysR family regulator
LRIVAFAFELISRTDAVMAVPAPVLVGQLNRGLLAEIPLEDPLPPIELGLCTRTETRLTPLAATLARVVADLMRRLPRGK